jgi:hypothetical protein
MLSDRMHALLERRSGFHHGTVRQWVNGRHMKNGTHWERIKSSRPARLASTVPPVQQMPVSPNVFVDPNDFSQQLIPGLPALAAVSAVATGIPVGEALAILRAQLDGEIDCDDETLESVRDTLRDVITEKIQSPSSPKGKAAYIKSLVGWSKAAGKVVQSYGDKLGDADQKDLKTRELVVRLRALLKNMGSELAQVTDAAENWR